MMTHTILDHRRQAQRLPADSKVARLMAGAPPGEENTAIHNTKPLLRRSLALSLLIISFFLGLTSNSTAQITAGGVLDNAYDRNGHPYGLVSLAVNDTIRADTGAFIPSVVCTDNTGYFQVYFEQGSGMENSADNTHLARRDVLCRVLRDLSAFMPSPLTSSDYKMQLQVRAPDNIPGFTGPAFGTSFYIVPRVSNISGRVENVAWSAMHSGKDPWIGISKSKFLSMPGALCDGFIAFDFAHGNWHTNLSTAPSANEDDEYTLALRELTHYFGLTSLIAADGSSKLGSGRTFYDGFDMRLTTRSGQPLIVATGFTPSTGCMFNPTLNATSVLSPDPSACMSDSTNCDTAIQYVGSVNVPVYTPNCFEPGSSLSCLEDQCSGGGNNNYFVTSNLTSRGSMKRYLRSEERLVLSDIGYATDTVYGDTATLNYSHYGSSRGVGSIVGGVNDGYFGPDSTDTVRISGLLDNDINADAFEDLLAVNGNGFFNVHAGNRYTSIVYTPGDGDGGLDAAVGSYIAVNLETFDRGPRMFFSFAPTPPPMIICMGSTATVPTCGGTGYGWWISSGTAVATIEYGTGIVHPVHTGSYTYYYGDLLGTHVECSGSGTVVATPDPISGPDVVCPNTFNNWVDLTGGGSWTAAYPLSLASSITSNPVTYYASAAGTSIITYNLNNNTTLSWGGCIATKSVTVTNVGVIHGPNPCAGSNGTMTETVSSGTWSVTPVTGAATISSTGVLHGVSAGIVTVSYSITSGGVTCSAAYSDTILASSPATITGVSPICTGQCYVFFASVAGGTWTSANSGIASAATSGPTTGLICGVSTGTTTISYSFTNACGTFVSTYSVTVIAGVGAVTYSGGPAYLCGATAVAHGVYHYTASPTGGSWSTSDASVVTVTSSGDVTVLSTTGYAYVTYLKSSGSCTGGFTIPVYPTTAVITGPTTMCQGQTIILYGSGDGNGNGSLTSSSIWSPTSTSITWLYGELHLYGSMPTFTSIYVYGAGGGTQTITYSFTDVCGTFTDTHNVTVTANTDTLTGPATICACAGTTFTYHTTVSTGTWSSSDPSVATINPTTGEVTPSTIITAPTSVTFYHIHTTGGCTFYTSYSVTVNPCPNTSIFGLTEICDGLYTTYSNATLGGVWSTSGPDLTTVSTDPTVSSVYVHATHMGTQTINYTVTNIYGCTMVASLSVQVDPVTAGTITVPSPFCAGGTGVCTSTASGGTWSSLTPAIATIHPTSGAITASTAGTTTISYAISNICGNFLATAPVTVYPNPVISGPSTLCAADFINLTASPGPGVFSWISGPGAVTPGGTVTGTTITVPASGYVKFTNTVTTCYSYDTILINPSPVISGPWVICFPNIDSFTVSPSVAGTWSSSDALVATISSTGVIYSVGLGTTTISFVITGTGCSTSRVITVCPVPHPVIVPPFPVRTLCVGQTTIIRATPAGSGGGASSGGGYWTSSSTAIASVVVSGVSADTSTAIIYGLDSGVAYITYTYVNRCGCAGFVVDTITINPTPTIAGPWRLCMGDTTGIFTETTGETGTWSSSVGTVATIDASTGRVYLVGPGTTVITFTNSYGCTSSRTLIVCVTPHPVFVGTYDTSLCVGQSTVLHVTPGATGAGGPYGMSWVSSSTSIASISPGSSGGDTATATVYGLDTGVVYITYTAYNNCGCYGSGILTIHVHPNPHISGPTMICYGTTATFTDTWGTAGTWSSSVTSVATIHPTTGVITTVSPGSTVITFTTAYGCTASQSLLVCSQVDAATDDTVKILCKDGTAVIHGWPGTTTASGTYNVSWSTSKSSVASVSMTDAGGATSTATVYGVDTGKAIITFTAISGCSCTGTRIVSITVTAPVITGPSILCMGTTGTFVEHTGVSGTWSSSNTSVATINSTTGVVTPVGPGTTIIKFTSVNGCVVTLTLTICASPKPVVISPYPTTILCVGSTTLIHASPGAAEETGPYNVSWSSSAPEIASVSMTDAGGVSSSARVYGVGVGTADITYMVTNPCGCVGIVITRVTISVIPVISGPSVLCMGNTVTFHETTGVSGTWSSSNTSVATINATTGFVTPVHPGTTTIKFTSIYGCITSVTLTVCAWSNPVIINPFPTTTLCVGATSAISASPGANYDQDESFNVSWESSNPNVAAVSMVSSGGATSSATVTAISAGTVDITFLVSSPCGCTGRVITRYTINSVPAVITGSATTFCAGASLTLSESSTGGTWSSRNNQVAQVNQQGVVSGVAGGTATISYSYPNAQGGCAATYDLTVTERATACVVSGYGQSCNNCWAAIFSGTSQATVTYHVENQQHSVIQGGYTTSANSEIPYSQMPQGTAYIAIDQVSATNCTWQGCGCQGGCSASALGNRGISNGGSGGTTGIGNITMKPNPNRGMFTLTGTIENQAATSIVNIEIVDMLGKVLYSDAIKAENGKITADILLGENIANGVYFLRIKGDDTNTVMRFTLDR